MSEDSQTLLKQLIEVSKIDSALAGIFAEKKKIEKELSELASALKRGEQECQQKGRSHQEKDQRYKKEERRLRDEQEKLIARRKSLSSLNNYKVQQAAEKEIEHAARQLSEQEEALLESLDEIDKAGIEAKSAEEKIAGLKADYEKANSEAREAFVAFEEREQRYQSERLALVQHIDQKSLIQYDRIRERIVMNPVVEVKDYRCTGCHMQVGPQLIVQVARGDTLVRCPGCGRIVYLSEIPGAASS